MWVIFTNVINIFFSVFLIVNALLFVPQIIRLLRNKHARDVSLITFAGFNIVNIFSVLHGVTVHDLFLIIGYALTVITNTIVTVLIIRYKYFSTDSKDKKL